MKGNQPDLLETLATEFASEEVSAWEQKIVAAALRRHAAHPLEALALIRSDR